jgi:hypothetical protein
MENTSLAKLANYKESKTWCVKNRQLCKVLDALGELLGIEFGSITVRFHQGKWSPKIEIEKRVIEEISE